ncbi:MAG: hypothetical protein LRY66_17400 [Saccharospirillaceae bacterium]|nr:hypothetical protein [Saccharospirillaceae bacterium]MCD8533080.1 hypothetical protein [Saccharospirillaceae bacterium]
MPARLQNNFLLPEQLYTVGAAFSRDNSAKATVLANEFDKTISPIWIQRLATAVLIKSTVIARQTNGQTGLNLSRKKLDFIKS